MTKIQHIMRWALLGLTTLAFLAAGTMKLLGTDMEVSLFTKWGYAPWFMYFIGVCEVLGAIGLHLRRVARPAAICLILLLCGAIGTHIVNAEGLATAIPAALIMLFLFGILHLDTKKPTVTPAAPAFT